MLKDVGKTVLSKSEVCICSMTRDEGNNPIMEGGREGKGKSYM